jgi:peptidoglycan/xylan/chitin deacetylase (PgdA/CDA1 family)
MRGIVFTFDDDVSSHYDVVAPIFEKHGLTATFFINGSKRNQWKTVVDFNDVCYDLADMSHEQLVELSNRGFEIGNHTYCHLHVRNHSVVDVLRSFDRAEAVYEKLGIPRASTVCYPGYVIPRDDLMEALVERGYRLGRIGYSSSRRIPDRALNNPQDWQRDVSSYYVPGKGHPLKVTCCGLFCDEFTFELFEDAIRRCPREAYCVFTGHVFTLEHQVEKLERVCEFCSENDLNVMQFKDLPVE